MSKKKRKILIVISIIAILLVIDLVSIFIRNKPVFAINKNCKCGYQVYRGLLYDTYNCSEYPTSQIKAKWDKFSCSFKVETVEKR